MSTGTSDGGCNTQLSVCGTLRGVQDLGGVDPELVRGLAGLLAFEGDVEGTYCRSFVAERRDAFGGVAEHELVPGGAEVPVTAENRGRYVSLLVDWLLRGSVARQLGAFVAGFTQVSCCPGRSAWGLAWG